MGISDVDADVSALFAKRLTSAATPRVTQCDATGYTVLEVDDPSEALNRGVIHRTAAQTGIDVLIASRPIAPCKLLVADMEATIIQDEMLDLLAEDRGIGEDVAKITARAMAGELDFAQSLVARTELLAGTPEGKLKALCDRIKYTPGAKTFVQSMRARGARAVLVTGGYDIFANAVARHCGFDDVVANRPVLKDGIMTGALHLPICTAETKRNELLLSCEALGIAPNSACCIGDGANDMQMLQACGFAVSYKGKPIVQNVVDLNITQGDLTLVLDARGA